MFDGVLRCVGCHDVGLAGVADDSVAGYLKSFCRARSPARAMADRGLKPLKDQDRMEGEMRAALPGR